MFELSGVNYEDVLEQGDSILVRVIASSSYRGIELSGLYCILHPNSCVNIFIAFTNGTRTAKHIIRNFSGVSNKNFLIMVQNSTYLQHNITIYCLFIIPLKIRLFFVKIYDRIIHMFL